MGYAASIYGSIRGPAHNLATRSRSLCGGRRYDQNVVDTDSHGAMPRRDPARISSSRNRTAAKHAPAGHALARSLDRSLRRQRRRTNSWIYDWRCISTTDFPAVVSRRRTETTGYFVPAVPQKRSAGPMGRRIGRSMFRCGLSCAAKKRKANVRRMAGGHRGSLHLPVTCIAVIAQLALPSFDA